jgi:hypothetical protein
MRSIPFTYIVGSPMTCIPVVRKNAQKNEEIMRLRAFWKDQDLDYVFKVQATRLSFN